MRGERQDASRRKRLERIDKELQMTKLDICLTLMLLSRAFWTEQKQHKNSYLFRNKEYVKNWKETTKTMQRGRELEQRYKPERIIQEGMFVPSEMSISAHRNFFGGEGGSEVHQGRACKRGRRVGGSGGGEPPPPDGGEVFKKFVKNQWKIYHFLKIFQEIFQLFRKF